MNTVLTSNEIINGEKVLRIYCDNDEDYHIEGEIDITELNVKVISLDQAKIFLPDLIDVINSVERNHEAIFEKKLNNWIIRKYEYSR
ncbi:hypothetical protein [Nonlabens sp.]|uniref:hypothetical protein n=1 Tax=Nonlabens sp. TaxID=1888209 RepID=UPI003F6A4CC1